MNGSDKSSSESEVDVMGDYRTTLKYTRPYKRKGTLSVGQSKTNTLKVKHRQANEDPPANGKKRKRRKIRGPGRPKKRVIESFVEDSNSNITVPPPGMNDSLSTLAYSSDDGNVFDIDDAPTEIKTQTYLERCLEKLSCEDIVKQCCEAFHKEDLLVHFITFLSLIASGKLSVVNIAVLCCMERAFLQGLRTTTAMRYRRDTSLFWETVYAIGGGKLLRFFSSDKNFGQVNSKFTEKSKYNPDCGHFNFAVPDERILTKSKTFIPKVVNPGFIEECLPYFQSDKEYILSLDGKQLGPGLSDFGEGDINLWGYEVPSLQEMWQDFVTDVATVNKVLDGAKSSNGNRLPNNVSDVKLVPQILSHRIKSLREAKVRHEKLRRSFNLKIKRFPGKKGNYTLAFSEIDAFILSADKVIQSLLELNRNWCFIMARINGSEEEFFLDKRICLEDLNRHWMLRDPEKIGNEDYLRENPIYIKQHSDLWFEMRSSSKVTGSSLYNALGLRSLKDMKQHYSHHIQHKEPTFNDVQLAAMKHGSDFEINAVATIIGVVLPAFTPACHQFIDVGPIFLPNGGDAKFMEISPDGIIDCIKSCKGKDCTDKLGLPVGKMVVEIKSPYMPIGNPLRMPVQYTPPEYYATQLLAEMQATQCSPLWFASCSPESLALSFVNFDEEKWENLWNLAVELYGGNNIPKPTSQHPLTEEYKLMLHDFIQEKAFLAVEVPTITCFSTEEFSDEALNINKCYEYRHPFHPKELHDSDIEEINRDIIRACERSLNLIDKAHNLQRRKATEILLFVATDADKEFNKDIPSSIPIAYALKGKSIRMETARNMVNEVRRKMHQNGINVLAEAYDGQWAQLVFRSQQNHPLTLFELKRDCWNFVATKGQKKLLSIIDDMSIVDAETQNELISMAANSSYDDEELLDELAIGNLEIVWQETNAGRCMSVSSKCGSFDIAAGLSYIETPTPRNRPDLWIQDARHSFTLFEILKEEENDDSRRSSSIGIQVSIPVEEDISDMDFHDSLDPDVLDLEDQMIGRDPFTDVDHCNIVYDHDSSEVSTESVSKAEKIRRLLLGERIDILEQFLISLLLFKRNAKWQSHTPRQLYEECLSTTQKIYEQFISEELNILISQLKDLAGNKFQINIKNVDSKVVKANEIGCLLGHLDQVRDIRKKVRMESLKTLSAKVIKSAVPLSVLRVALASWKFDIDLSDWLDKSTVPLSTKIPVHPFVFDFFSYPEYCQERKSVEMRVIDPSHCLTNLRLHATTRGFFGCSKNAFIRVSQQDNNLISRAMIEEPIADKQSVPFAEQIFCSQVEEQMRNNGDMREAELVRHVRRWYQACNSRGLSVSTRIKYLLDMHNYFLAHFDARYFPMSTTHVQGLPSITFQSVLQNCSARIQLYAISQKKTYNHRYVSTLPTESMFSDLGTLARNTSGCPLAVEIPRYISKMTKLNAIKIDPSKNFDVRTTRKTTYPTYPAEPVAEQNIVMTDERGNVLFRTHSFDLREENIRIKKHRKRTITFGQAPLRGVRPLRELYYKTKESNIPAMTRMGF